MKFPITKTAPDPIEELVSGATALIDDRRKISEAIGRARTRMSETDLLVRFEKAALAETLSDRELGDATDADVVEAENAVSTAQENYDRAVMTLAGLRKKLMDQEADAALADAENQINAILPDLAKECQATAREDVLKLHRDLVNALLKFNAIGTASGSPKLLPELVNSITRQRQAGSGEPLPFAPTGTEIVLETIVPRVMDRATALGMIPNARLQRLLTVKSDLDWCRSLAVGERSRVAREKRQSDLSARGGRPRPLDRSWTTSPNLYESSRPIVPAPSLDPDLRYNQRDGVEFRGVPVIQNPAD